MSKNVKVNGANYSGVSIVQLQTAEGGTATFKDVDEIVTAPSGGVETGTFVGDGTAQVTLPVTSKKQGYSILVENYDTLKEDVSSLANMSLLYSFCDDVHKRRGSSRVYNGGVASGFEAKENNSTHVEFTDDSVIIKNGPMFSNETFLSGKTYHWIAW